MAPGAVFYVSTGREKKMAIFSRKDTARLGNAKDRDEPSGVRRAGLRRRRASRRDRRERARRSPSPRRDRVASPMTQP